MPRPPRLDPPGGYHHVMNRGVNRQRVFFDDRDRREFIRLLGEIHTRFGIRVVAYCLMDNHFHLVLSCPDGNLSRGMQFLTSTYTRHTNDRVGRDGPLFRGRFLSIPITTDAYLQCAVRYVHRNCLDLAGVVDPTRYRWCSHLAYVAGSPTAGWLELDRVLGLFVDSHSFDEFVRGDETFVGGVELRGDDLRAIVKLRVADLDGMDEGRTRRQLERTVLHLVVDADGLNWAGDLPEDLAPRSGQARRSALHRARQRLRDRPELSAIVASTIEALTHPEQAA